MAAPGGFQSSATLAPRRVWLEMDIDPELLQLKLAEQSARDRLLRLRHFPDMSVVAAASSLWNEAFDKLNEYRAKASSPTS